MDSFRFRMLGNPKERWEQLVREGVIDRKQWSGGRWALSRLEDAGQIIRLVLEKKIANNWKVYACDEAHMRHLKYSDAWYWLLKKGYHDKDKYSPDALFIRGKPAELQKMVDAGLFDES